MDVYEITASRTGRSEEGINYLEPKDSFTSMENGFVYRQVIQSRQGFFQFSNSQLGVGEANPDGTRVMGIFEHILPDNTKQLLVCTKKYLYVYKGATDHFAQIPFASALAITDFTTDATDGGFTFGSTDYVSGTDYPFPNGTQRFVFTGRAMGDTYMYDGTNVKRFTLVADNPAYAKPPQQSINPLITRINALHVQSFNGRLNLFYPNFITSYQQGFPQGVLFSGIANVAGNGDKFNVVGSGLFQFDTTNYMTNMELIGDFIFLDFYREKWALEKTKDVFNPYYPRKIPSAIGSNCAFTSATWDNNVESLGQSGIALSDGRKSLRTDTKIPYFTVNEISQANIQLSYALYDRKTAQFLYSFSSDGTQSTADKVLTHNYEEGSWAVNDMRFSVFGESDVGQDLIWDQIDENIKPSWIAWDSTTEIWDKIGLGTVTQKTLAGDDLGFIYQLDTDFDDYEYFITAPGVTVGAFPTIINIGVHALQVGDRIAVTDVVGVVNPDGDSINNYDSSTDPVSFVAYTITAITSTTISIDFDSTLSTAWISGGIITKLIAFSAETIPFNPYRDQGQRVFISHIEFLLDTDDGYLFVDILENENNTPFKINIPVVPTSTTDAREWITVSVNDSANFFTFILKQESPELQVRLTSMRIHCMPHGLTSW